MELKKVNVGEAIANHKIGLIIAAILCIAIGILLLIAPWISGGVIIWAVVALVGVGGLGCFLRFFLPKEKGGKNVAEMIFGLLLIALVILTIVLACVLPPIKATVEGQVVTYSGFQRVTLGMVGFLSIFFGIMGICASIQFMFQCIGEHEKYLWVKILGSILTLILSVMMVIFPFFMATVAIMISGVYLVIASIACIVIVCKNWNKKAEDIHVDL